MAYARPLIIPNERLNRTRDREREIKRLEAQVQVLLESLGAARNEIELLTYERDELILALRGWARDRA